MKEKSRVQDYDWALGLNRLCLQVIGAWPTSPEIDGKLWRTIFPIPFMIVILMIFSFLPQMYALVLVRSDYLLIIDNIMTSVPTFASCWKLFFLWRVKEVLRPVVSSVAEDWLRSKSSWEYEIMRAEARLAKLFTIGGYIFVACSYLGFFVAPFLGINIRFLTNITDYADRHLMFQSYYPYDYSKTPNYEFTHFAQILGGAFIALAMAIPDNYFGALVFHISGQFKILGIDIERFVRADDTTLLAAKSNTFNRCLALYIDRHVHLISLVAKVEQSFTFIIFCQLLCMYVMACCLGFRILHMLETAADSKQIIPILNLAVAMISLMLFMLVDCNASETLSFYSAGLFNSIYNCKWYLISKQSTRDFILMMIASKSPKSLTAGKIVCLSMPTYLKILKSIAGYISVLIAVNS